MAKQTGTFSLDEYFVISAMRESNTPLIDGGNDKNCFVYSEPDATSNKLLALRALSASKGCEMGLLEAFDCMRLLDKAGPLFIVKDDEINWCLFEKIAEFDNLTPVEMLKQQGDLGYNALSEYVERKVTQLGL